MAKSIEDAIKIRRSTIEQNKTNPASEKPEKKTEGVSFSRSKILWLVIGFFLGIGIAISMGYYWFEFSYKPTKEKISLFTEEKEKYKQKIQQLKEELKDYKVKLENIKIGNKRLSQVLKNLNANWDRVPEKPRYLKTNKGVIIYWYDREIRRRYFIYEGKGKQGLMKKITYKPSKKNFIYMLKYKPGIWRYAISALNSKGKETKKSQTLTIKFPVKK